MVRGLRISPLTEGILEEVVWERRLRMKEAQRPVTESKLGLMTRRTLLQRASAAAAVGMIGTGPLAMADASAADKTKAFPTSSFGAAQRQDTRSKATIPTA